MAPSAGTLVVLTQHAWGAAPLWRRRSEGPAEAIAAVRPDVVGLQEIHAESLRGPSQLDEGTPLL